MKRLRLVIVILLVLLSSCASQLPRPLPTPRARMTHQVFVPVVTRPLNKLGLAGCPPSCREFGCSWCYSWSSNPGTRPGVESVPMVWDEMHIYDPIDGNSAWVMGFNEPDLCPAQACMSIDEVVDGWRVIETRFPDRKLLAPTWSHMHPWALVEWVQRFEQRVGRPPRIDGVGVHCYHPTAAQCIGVTQMHIAWANEWSRAWGRPIEVWVTEFYFPSPADGQAYATWLDGEPAVTRWSPFVSYIPCWLVPDEPDGWHCAEWGDPSVLRADLTTLTPLGEWYARPDPDYREPPR